MQVISKYLNLDDINQIIAKSGKVFNDFAEKILGSKTLTTLSLFTTFVAITSTYL